MISASIRRHKNLSKKRSNTLLEKAKTFQEIQPDSDVEFSSRNDKNDAEQNRENDSDSFLEEYYRDMEKKREEERRMKKKTPATLYLQLKYNPPKILKNQQSFFRFLNRSRSDDDNKSFESKSVIQKKRGISLCGCSGRKKKVTTRSKFVVILYDAVYLKKLLTDQETNLKKCEIVTEVSISNMKKSKVLKSAYGYCNQDGSCAWYHEIVLKDFSLVELSKTYMKFTIKGINKGGKLVLCQSYLGGSQAVIKEKFGSRSINAAEHKRWDEALTKVDSPVIMGRVLKRFVEKVKE